MHSNSKNDDKEQQEFLGQFDNKAKLFMIFGVGFFMGIIAICGLYFREFDSSSTLRPEVIKTNDKRPIVTATLNDASPKKHLQSTGFVKPANIPLLGNGTYKRPSYPWLSHNSSNPFWRPFIGKNYTSSKPVSISLAPKKPTVPGASNPVEASKRSPAPVQGSTTSVKPVVNVNSKPNTVPISAAKPPAVPLTTTPGVATNRNAAPAPKVDASKPASPSTLAAQQKAAKQPVAQQPVVKQPVPIAQQPVVKQPAATTPVVNKVPQTIPSQQQKSPQVNSAQPPKPQIRMGGNLNRGNRGPARVM